MEYYDEGRWWRSSIPGINSMTFEEAIAQYRETQTNQVLSSKMPYRLFNLDTQQVIVCP